MFNCNAWIDTYQPFMIYIFEEHISKLKKNKNKTIYDYSEKTKQ